MSRNASENGLPSRIAAMVRGPQSLREDIADEIADHLACHEEDEPAADPAAAHAAAVRAFGNAEQVARELRAIHLGDLIMFQKITIAALVVIVAGMAATAYFSYQSSRQTAAQFAQTAEKFDEMNQQLTTLVDLQRSAIPKQPPPPTSPQPPAPSGKRVRIRCVFAPNNEPAAECRVECTAINRGPVKALTTNTTDADGWISTEPLPEGTYQVEIQAPPTDKNSSDNTARARRWVSIDPKKSDPYEMTIVVASRHQHTVSIKLPDDLSWDRSKMSDARIRFVREGGSGYLSRIETIDLFKPNRISGLVPGKASVWLCLRCMPRKSTPPAPFPAAEKPEQGDAKIDAWYEIAEISIPEEAGPLEIPMISKPRQAITGILYDGTRDKPLSDTGFQLMFLTSGALTAPPTYSSGGSTRDNVIQQQYLRTDPQGRFSTCMMQSLPDSTSPPRSRAPSPGPQPFYAGAVSRIGVPHNAPGGRQQEIVWFRAEPPVKVFPLADGNAFIEIDVSQVGTVRVSLSDVEGLSAAGRSADRPVSISPAMVSGRGMWRLDEWDQALECRPSETLDFLLPAGKYVLVSRLSLTERDPSRPDVERRCRYERSNSSKEPVEIKPGEVSQITVPIGDLKGWELEDSEWRRAGTTQPATTPAAAAASAER